MQETLFRCRNAYGMMQYAFIISIIALYFIPLKVPGAIYLMAPLIITGLFFLFRQVAENLKRMFMIYRTTLVLYIYTIPDYIIKCVSQAIRKKIPKGIGIMFGIVFAGAGAYLLFSDNKRKEEQIASMKSFVLQKTMDDPEDDYDIVICKNKQTGEDVVMDADARYTHMLIIGPTGCGKTSAVIDPMIEQDIRKGHSVLVIEPKGDLAEKVYAMGKLYNKDVLYFDPTAPDCPKFNPLHGREDEVIENLTTTFTMLAPDSKTYFKNVTDNLIRKSVMVLKRIEEAYRNPDTGISSRPATLFGLFDVLHNTNGIGRRLMNDLLKIPTLTKDEEKQNRDTAAWFNQEYYADGSKYYENSSDVRQQVAKLTQNRYLRSILNPEDGISDIDFDEILAKGKSIAITTAQGSLRELGSYLGYFIIFTLQSAIFRRPGNEWTRLPSFLYVDEFQKYANPGMSDILTQGRAYRVGCILATQSRGGIATGIGSEGIKFLQTVDTNARSIVVFPGISVEDAEYYSKAFGTEIKTEVRHGESKQKFSLAYGFKDMNYPTETVQYSETEKNIYSGSDLTYKFFSEITYRLIANKSVQPAGDGIVSWIPKEINGRLDAIVEEYNYIQQEKRDKKEREERLKREQIYRKFQNGLKNNTGETFSPEADSGGGWGSTVGAAVGGIVGEPDAGAPRSSAQESTNKKVSEEDTFDDFFDGRMEG